MRDKFAIDSNVLVYALNSSSPLHGKAVEFLEKARSREALIPLQCLGETYRAGMKKDKEEKAADFTESLAVDTAFQLEPASHEDLIRSLGVEESFWDAMIEQTALRKGYEVIYTRNTADFREIEAVNPF